MPKRKLPKGPMKGAQRGSAVKVKSFYMTVRKRVGGRLKKVRVKVDAYKRGKPGGKRG